jgi:Flp pilus assembly protein TadG
MVRASARSAMQRARRGGTVTVEAALVLPTMVLLLAGLMEFGHVFMVKHMLNGAARRAAHYGSFEGVSTSEVEDRANEILNASFDAAQATVIVRDAGIFDTSTPDATTLDYSGLPTIDLTQAETGDAFLVQIQVPYDNVALLPPFWVQGHTITGRAIMRHE